MTTEFKMVPVEPTEEMNKQGMRWMTGFQHMRANDRRNALNDSFKAMLAAAPASPQDAQPAAWQYRVSAGPQTGWSLWHDGKGEEFKYSYQVETRPLYTHADAGEVERLREVEDAYKALEAVVVLTAKAVGDDTGLMWQKIQFAFLRDIPALRAKLAERDKVLRHFARCADVSQVGTASTNYVAALSTTAKPE